MKKFFEVIIEQDENGVYFASVPELPGCYSQADSLDELKEHITEAIEAYLESIEKDELKQLSHFVGVQKVEVSIK